MPTKKELQDLNAALAAENAELRAQLSALKTQRVAAQAKPRDDHGLCRPALFMSPKREDAFTLRNRWAGVAAKRGLDRKFAVQPVRVQRCGTETTMYAVF